MTFHWLPGFQVTERMWQAVIPVSSATVIILTVWCLAQGISTVFMHLYYIPIVLLAYHYRKKGIILCILLSLFYFTASVIYHLNNTTEIEAALIRVIIFIAIAVLIAYLSENLVTARDSLKNITEVQQGIIQNANVWLMVLDRDGRIHEWNRAAERISGYPAGEVIGKKDIWKQIYPEKKYRKEITRKIVEIIAKNNYLENLRTTITCSDGNQKIILWNTKELPHENSQSPRFIAVGVDITDRTLAEEALIESEKRYSALFSNNYSVSLLIDPDTATIVDANDAAVRYYGYTRDQLLSMKISDLNGLPEDKVIGNLKRAKNEREKHFFSTHYRAGSEKRNVEIYSGPITVQGKSLFYSVIHDITERKMAEAALQKSQYLLSEALEMANIGHWEFDVPTGIFTFNDRFYALYATTAEQEGGYQMAADVYAKEFVHPDDGDIVAREVTNAITTTNPDYLSQVEHRIIRRDGIVRHIIVRIRITKDATGRTIKTHGANQDITERKQAEEALRESRQLFSDIISFLPDPTFVIDRDGKVLAWNRALEKFSGVPAGDIIGKGNYEYSLWVHGKRRPLLIDLVLYPDKDSARLDYTDIHWEGHTVTAQTVITRTGNGQKIPVSLVTSPLIDSQGKIIGAIESIRDITLLKKAEEDLARLNTGLEKIVRDRTKALEDEVAVRKKAEASIQASLDEKVLLLREIHHRVKNNLQIIISLTNLQMRMIEDPKMKQLMAETKNRVRAMSLVHEKLYMSENISSIDLSEYTRFLAAQLFAFYGIDNSKVQIKTDIDKIPLDINMAIPLGLILNELISNALKHAFPDGRNGTISISGHTTDDMLNLVVKDDGTGLRPDFDWRNAESLGLRLINSLVDQLNGTLGLGTGAGTEFIISIPRKGGYTGQASSE